VSAHLRNWWPGLEISVDRDAVPALSEDRERLWSQVAAADFLSASEKRQLLGLESGR
jgi:phage portal protein BeeE